MDEAEAGGAVIVGVADEAGAAALVCVLRCDMRSSLDENLLPHTSFPFIQLQTCADDGADREGVSVAAAPLAVDTVEDAGGEAAEVGINVGGGGSDGPDGPESGGGSKSPDGYGKGGGRTPAAAA